MKQNKKGFTLIELLAVIVILAIIALIAVPVIMNIISSARKSAFEDTAYGIIKAGELYYASSLLNDGMTSDAEFTFNDGVVSPEGLSVQGSLPQSGKLVVTTDGKTAIAISNGTYCITKGYDESKITTIEEFETCDLPAEPAKTLSELAKTNEFATTKDDCATRGTCEVGTKFAIEVAPGNIQNFYVVSDVKNKVTLIMHNNIGESVAWISKKDYNGTEEEWDVVCNDCGNNNKGPITALDYLEDETSDWTNVPARTYTLVDEQGLYTIERTNARARMLTYTEADDIKSHDWAYDNLNNLGTGVFPFGYWLSTTSSADDAKAQTMWYGGTFNQVTVSSNGPLGVRPVIELSK